MIINGTYDEDNLVGTEFSDTISGGLSSDTLSGLAGDDRLDGGHHSDELYGGDDNDTLLGRGYGDTLDGGSGADYMVGGSGDDVFYTDQAGDTVVEVSDQGNDLVIATYDYQLALYLEQLTLVDTAIRGSGNQRNNVLTGNDADNILGAGWGNDRLYGKDGDDTLKGGRGIDTMDGGEGADVYYVDNEDDVIIENGTDGAIDRVMQFVDYTYTSSELVELVWIDGWAPTNVWLEGATTVTEIRGNDNANGFFLSEETTHVTLIGGKGNDTYNLGANPEVAGQPNGNVIEAHDAGTDRVVINMSYKLTAHVENLDLRPAEATAANGIGNGIDNEIVGSDGDNTLIGREGNDTLVGQGGADTFVFDRDLGPDNIDFVFDFVTGQDTLLLRSSIFTALSAGALSASAFHLGTEATETSHRVIYDQATGTVIYDADGSGAGLAQHFLDMQEGTVLLVEDILVF